MYKEISRHYTESLTLDPERYFADLRIFFGVFRMTEVACDCKFTYNLYDFLYI